MVYLRALKSWWKSRAGFIQRTAPQKAQLSRRDRATLYVSSCCVSRGMAVGKVSYAYAWAYEFLLARVTFKVTQRHWHWCHSIDHIRFLISLPLRLCLYPAPLTRYCELFPKIWWGHVTLNTSLWGVMYHARTLNPLYQSAHQIWSVKLYQFQRYDCG